MRLEAIIKEANLNLNDVLLFRHNLSNKEVRQVYDEGFLETYQCIQGRADLDQLMKKSKYVLSFLGTTGTKSTFLGCYEIGERFDGDKRAKMKPASYPLTEQFDHGYYYELTKTETLCDLVERLIVDWGKDPINWFKPATRVIEVLQIKPDSNYQNDISSFRSYEELILTYDELVTITSNPQDYQDYYQALSSVNGIYLICDNQTGKQYVGTTFGQEGLWGRWLGYAKTIHNNNTGMIEELRKRPDTYKNFQYTIMRVLPKPIDQREAERIEKIYKKKLGSQLREFGLNNN